MGSPEGQDFGKLGSCQSSALERNYPLCLALLQLYTHRRQTDPNPSKKINNYINREKRQSQPVLSNQRPPHQSCPVTRQSSIPLWKSVDFSQWPQHQTKTKNQNTPGGDHALPWPSSPLAAVPEAVTKPNLASSSVMWVLINPFDKEGVLDQPHPCPDWNAGIGFAPDFFTLCRTVWSHWDGETSCWDPTSTSQTSLLSQTPNSATVLISHIKTPISHERSSDRSSKIN